jgi:hypothetical protein
MSRPSQGVNDLMLWPSGPLGLFLLIYLRYTYNNQQLTGLCLVRRSGGQESQSHRRQRRGGPLPVHNHGQL